MEKVFGYIRISSKGQERGFGRELQAKAIQDLCRSKNLDLLQIYTDSAISGTEKGFEQRDAFHKMILDCEGKKIKKIVTYDLSRFWRDDVTKVLIKKEFEKNRLEILSYNQPQYTISTKEASEFLVSSMLDAIATFERMQIISRLNAGRASKLAQGKFGGGGVSLGYATKDKDLVIDEKEMALVKRIFRMKRKGLSMYMIAKILNEKGIRGKKGGKIEPSTIRKILKRKQYKGFVVYGGKSYKASQINIF